jgi:hypothetical protein
MTKLNRFYGPRPQFGPWTIGPNLFAKIRELLPDGGTILELGSGDGTGLLAEHYTMFSVEHDLAFVGRHDSTYVHAPITNGWYTIDAIKEGAPDRYDLLLVDGPPGTIGRLGMLDHLDLFDLGVHIIVDDINRMPEYQLLTALVSATGRSAIYGNEADGRGWGVISDKR